MRFPGAAEPEYRTMVVVDVCGAGRDDLARARAEKAMERVVRRAFRAAGVGWWRVVVPDGGHGMVVLVPAKVSKVDLRDALIPALLRELRLHNARNPPIRLRMAVCAGEVRRHRLRWLADDLSAAFRVLQADVACQDLAVIVSDVVYRAVARHGVRAVDYQPVHRSTTSDDVPRPARTASRPGS
ncbi:hypothetical protein [Lentzea aerocolonigenes]|uniref:hypothetical protein n=1 Tax=Lentzea aerocolonigenes TaxID=68170 RepID=UPI00068B05E8|nr:hypothetical protein [Lentzea aerocolonigenes]MCP2245079.1 hypothetical protein [Lentzea aerocolonigenes]